MAASGSQQHAEERTAATSAPLEAKRPERAEVSAVGAGSAETAAFGAQQDSASSAASPAPQHPPTLADVAEAAPPLRVLPLAVVLTGLDRGLDRRCAVRRDVRLKLGDRVLEAEAHEPLRVLALVERDRPRLSEDNLRVAAEVHDLAIPGRAKAPIIVIRQQRKAIRQDLRFECHGVDGAPLGFTSRTEVHGSSSSRASRIGQSLRGTFAAALGDELSERPLHRVELGDALFDVGDLGLGARLDVAAASSRCRPQIEEVTDLLQREAEGLGADDELQPTDGLGAVLAVARLRARGLGDEPLTLVEADGLDPEASGFGDFSDRHRRHRSDLLSPSLNPVVHYRVKAGSGTTAGATSNAPLLFRSAACRPVPSR